MVATEDEGDKKCESGGFVQEFVTVPRMRTHNLELDRLSLELNGTNLEINADCRDVTFCVGIVRKTEEEARLAAHDTNYVLCDRKK